MTAKTEAVLEAERIIENAYKPATTINWGLSEIVAFLVEEPLSTIEIIQDTHVPDGWAWVSYTPYRGMDPVVLVPTIDYGPTFIEYYGALIRHLVDYRYAGRQWFQEANRLLSRFEELYRNDRDCPFDLDLLLSKLRQWIARPYLPNDVVKHKKRAGQQ